MVVRIKGAEASIRLYTQKPLVLLRHETVAAQEARDARAALSVSSMLNTRPRATVIVSWMGVITTLSAQGSCASPAPTAPAEMLLAWMMK